MRKAKNTVDLKTVEGTKPCLIRLVKDLEEIKQMRNVKLDIPDPQNIQHFMISINVSEGLYAHKWFRFNFNIPDEWPNVAPEVIIVDKIWHPNIQLVKADNELKAGEDKSKFLGKVCVSILRAAYKPSILLSAIVTGLQFLLQHPNPNDALNIEAAQQQKQNYEAFKAQASFYLDNMPDDDDDE